MLFRSVVKTPEDHVPMIFCSLKIYMMKKACSITLLIAFALPVFAQGPSKANVHFGETVRMSLKTFFFNMRIIGCDETGIYGMQTPPTEIFGKANLGGTRHFHLARYNHSTLDNPETIAMTFEGSDDERNYEFAAQIGDQIYIFTSTSSRKLRKTFLFAETVSKKPFSLNKDVRQIAEVSWSNETPYERSNFGFAFSPDKTKIMIRYSLMDSNSQVLQFGVCAFDSTLLPLWQSDLNIPVAEGSFFNFKKFHIDNNGDIYVVGRVFKTKWDLKQTNYMQNKTLLSGDRMATREPIYAYQIIAYANKGKAVSNFVLQEPGKFITELNVAVDNKRDIILTGFYGNEGSTSVIGAFSMKIKAGSDRITNKVFHGFEKDFILKDLPDGDAKIVSEQMDAGEEFDKYDYKIDDIQFHDNGTFTMIAEQYIEEIKTIGGGNYVTTEDHFYDDNLIIITFASDGKVAWKQKIAKRQHTRHAMNHVYASYAMLRNQNKMYFIFNEFADNKPKQSTAVMVIVNEDGSIYREALFSADDKKVVQPMTYKITGEKEMYMFEQTGKWNYSLARFNFN